MKFIIRSHHIIAKKLRVEAIVLYPFILFAGSPSDSLLTHELIHIKQIELHGVLAFYTQYFLEYIQGRYNKMSHQEAYLNISFEKQAYAQDDFIKSLI